MSHVSSSASSGETGWSLLSPLGWAAAAAASGALIYCVALGLLEVCGWIEAHYASARRVGVRLVWFCTVTSLTLALTDKLPLLACALSALSNLCHGANLLLSPHWPSTGASTPRHLPRSLFLVKLRSTLLAWLANVAVTSVPAHLLLASHLSASAWEWAEFDRRSLERPKWPGGRLDWDVEQPTRARYSALQATTAVALCVWAVPVWTFLGACATEWGLPQTLDHFSSATSSSTAAAAASASAVGSSSTTGAGAANDARRRGFVVVEPQMGTTRRDARDVPKGSPGPISSEAALHTSPSPTRPLPRSPWSQRS